VRLEIACLSEVFEQLAGRIGFPRVPVISEASSVRRREPPRLALPEVGKDLAGAAENLPVLGLQDGDLICSGQLTESFALLGPGLHLPDDGIDAELGQHLANR
jgi:hypothetical protein